MGLVASPIFVYRPTVMTENWRKIGKVKEAHALKGELYVLVFSRDTSWIKKLTEVKIDDSLFVVERVKAYKDGLILKCEKISDRTAAEKLIGGLFYIPSELLVSKKGESIYLSEIENFSVFDNNQLVGRITGFSSNGPQDLLVVTNEQKSYEIPFVEDFLVKIDFAKQQVLMNLPPGLLQLDEK